MRKTRGVFGVLLVLGGIVVACEDSPSEGDSPAPASLDASTGTGQTDADAAPSVDAAGDGSSPDGSCVPGAPCGAASRNYAFITSSTHVLGELGGVEAADALCNERAIEAGLEGTYVAWLSSSASNVAERLGNASGWVRTDGRVFAPSREDLFAGRIHYPLTFDEANRRVEEEFNERIVATATRMDGTFYDDGVDRGCSDWKSTTGDAVSGIFSQLGQSWTVGNLQDCSTATRLYCLGIDHDAAYTVVPIKGRRAFLSSETFTPDLGLAGADALCAADAESAGLTGTFRSLLGTTTAAASSRFDTNGPVWVRVDGVALMDAAASLATADSLLTPVLMDADGTTTRSGFVWTGSSSPGDVTTATCNDWTSVSASPSGIAGIGYETVGWFGFQSIPCNFSTPGRVYCLEE